VCVSAVSAAAFGGGVPFSHRVRPELPIGTGQPFRFRSRESGYSGCMDLPDRTGAGSFHVALKLRSSTLARPHSQSPFCSNQEEPQRAKPSGCWANRRGLQEIVSFGLLSPLHDPTAKQRPGRRLRNTRHDTVKAVLGDQGRANKARGESLVARGDAAPLGGNIGIFVGFLFCTVLRSRPKVVIVNFSPHRSLCESRSYELRSCHCAIEKGVEG